MADAANDEEIDDVPDFVKDGDETIESDETYSKDTPMDTPESSKSSNDKAFKLRIDMSSIPCIPETEQESELQGLGVVAYEQRSYEQGVLKQVDEAIKSQTDLKSVSKEPTLKEKIRSVLAFQSTTNEEENEAEDKASVSLVKSAASTGQSFEISRLSESTLDDHDIKSDDDESPKKV